MNTDRRKQTVSVSIPVTPHLRPPQMGTGVREPETDSDAQTPLALVEHLRRAGGAEAGDAERAHRQQRVQVRTPPAALTCTCGGECCRISFRSSWVAPPVP